MTDEERATRLSAGLYVLRLDRLELGDDPEEKREHEVILAAFAAIRREQKEECAKYVERFLGSENLSGQTIMLIRLIVIAIRTM